MNDAEKRELIAWLRNCADMSDHGGDVPLIKAADALEETLWRDIESAPYRDGKEFIALVMGDIYQMAFIEGEFWDVIQNSIVGYPTHYKPLDAPE